jgi:hypothetical protein
MLGVNVLTKTIINSQSTIQLDNLNQLPAGVYTVIWNSSNGKYSERLTIK